MKLTFLGATGTVTGSKYLLEHNRTKVLIDCGLFQGLKKLRLQNWSDLPFNVEGIDSVVLTHAHIDHSGYVPRLVKQGFKGKVYCTPPTRDLCKVLLPDCGYLQEEEARYANKRGYSKHKPALPLFSLDEAQESLKHFRPVRYQTKFDLGDGLTLEFRNAGHILGSAHVVISNGDKTITFSGDIGRENDPILNPSDLPNSTDYLVMESTYGNRRHPDSDPQGDLAKVINQTVDRGGTIILPAFAVGRTQMVLYYLSKLKQNSEIPDIPVFLNSPMASNVTNLYCEHRNSHTLTDDQCKEMCNVATYVNSVEESKALNSNKYPKLIIAASGMATGGRVIHHLKTYAPYENNTLLFTGFQAAGTRGEKIVGGSDTVKIHGQHVPVRAEVQNLSGLSAHADSEELIKWVKRFESPPKLTFVTHGEPNAAAEFRSKLENTFNTSCVVPEYLAEVEL